MVFSKLMGYACMSGGAVLPVLAAYAMRRSRAGRGPQGAASCFDSSGVFNCNRLGSCRGSITLVSLIERFTDQCVLTDGQPVTA
jgi:hypothetical protein